MGHIVIATPPIRRFRLLLRLRRELGRRGHRVRLLATDPIAATFWRHQAGEIETVAATAGPGLPPDVLAAIAQRHGLCAGQHRGLSRSSAGMLHWLERDPPDLILCHESRTPANACLQHLAGRVGADMLWSGDGLLPGTMQIDARGLDGDAGCRRWSARDFRVVRPDRALLDAGLAHALAGASPFELPAPEVVVPPLRERLADALRMLCAGHWRSAATALHAWRDAVAPSPIDTAFTGHDPRGAANGPSFAVLLQPHDDPTRRLDADQPPDNETLLRRSIAAVRALDAAAQVAVIAPDGELDRLRARCGDAPRLVFVPQGAAATWLATAAAVITVNHRLTGLALVCGTPIVNLGRGLFDVAGITTRGASATLADDLSRALRRDHAALRRRVLSWQLRHGHVWCSADQPNHNGMLGLVQAIEQQLAGGNPPRPLPYRPGPTWPLTTN